MKKDFTYSTQSVGTWTETDPKKTLLRLISPYIVALWSMEDEGTLSSMLCAVPTPCLYPHWAANAAQCTDPVFRRKGLKAGDHLLNWIKGRPAKVSAFRKLADLGTVLPAVASEFEEHLWGRIVNYCFLRFNGAEKFGRRPAHFLIGTAEMLEAYVLEPGEAWECPHCTMLHGPYRDLVNSGVFVQH